MTRNQTVIEEWLRKDRNPAPVAKLLGFQLTGFEDGVAGDAGSASLLNRTGRRS